MSIDRESQITALENAISVGVKTISVDGQSVTYNSVDDMLKALRFLKRQCEIESGGSQTKPPIFSMTSTLRNQC